MNHRPGECQCLLKNVSVENMNDLVLALLLPQGRLEITSQRLLMLFRAIRDSASGFVSMDAIQKNAAIAEL